MPTPCKEEAGSFYGACRRASLTLGPAAPISAGGGMSGRTGRPIGRRRFDRVGARRPAAFAGGASSPTSPGVTQCGRLLCDHQVTWRTAWTGQHRHSHRAIALRDRRSPRNIGRPMSTSISPKWRLGAGGRWVASSRKHSPVGSIQAGSPSTKMDGNNRELAVVGRDARKPKNSLRHRDPKKSGSHRYGPSQCAGRVFWER